MEDGINEEERDASAAQACVVTTGREMVEARSSSSGLVLEDARAG
jgi:hypothetical protein